MSNMIFKTQKQLNELMMLVNAYKMCDYSCAFHTHIDVEDHIALHKIINTLEDRIENIQQKVDCI